MKRMIDKHRDQNLFLLKLILGMYNFVDYRMCIVLTAQRLFSTSKKATSI